MVGCEKEYYPPKTGYFDGAVKSWKKGRRSSEVVCLFVKPG